MKKQQETDNQTTLICLIILKREVKREKSQSCGINWQESLVHEKKMDPRACDWQHGCCNHIGDERKIGSAHTFFYYEFKKNEFKKKEFPSFHVFFSIIKSRKKHMQNFSKYFLLLFIIFFFFVNNNNNNIF